MLPELSGLEVTRQIRAESSVPIVMLTARDAEVDKVVGLELGADDYVTKPFSSRELAARGSARCSGAGIRSRHAAPADGRARAGPGRPGGPPRASRRRGVPVKPKVFDLLAFLLRHPGQVISRDQLLEQVWGYDYPGETRTVDVHVHWLRAVVEPDPQHRRSSRRSAARATSSAARRRPHRPASPSPTRRVRLIPRRTRLITEGTLRNRAFISSVDAPAMVVIGGRSASEPRDFPEPLRRPTPASSTPRWPDSSGSVRASSPSLFCSDRATGRRSRRPRTHPVAPRAAFVVAARSEARHGLAYAITWLPWPQRPRSSGRGAGARPSASWRSDAPPRLEDPAEDLPGQPGHAPEAGSSGPRR